MLTKLVVAPSEIIDLQHQIHSNNFPDTSPVPMNDDTRDRSYQHQRSREGKPDNSPFHVAIVRRDVSDGTNRDGSSHSNSRYTYSDNFLDLKTTSSNFGTTIRYRDETDSERRVKFDSMEDQSRYQRENEECVLDRIVIDSKERKINEEDNKLETSVFTSTPISESVETKTQKISESSLTRVGVINK